MPGRLKSNSGLTEAAGILGAGLPLGRLHVAVRASEAWREVRRWPVAACAAGTE
jgi:hypothetical protein